MSTVNQLHWNIENAKMSRTKTLWARAETPVFRIEVCRSNGKWSWTIYEKTKDGLKPLIVGNEINHKQCFVNSETVVSTLKGKLLEKARLEWIYWPIRLNKGVSHDISKKREKWYVIFDDGIQEKTLELQSKEEAWKHFHYYSSLELAVIQIRDPSWQILESVRN